MSEVLEEGEMDRDTHRSIILALGGFSFAGALGLAATAVAVSDLSIRQNLQFPIFYLIMSFLSYLFALNIQGYKFFRWLDQLSDLLMELASLLLLLSVVALVRLSNLDANGSTLIGIITIGGWMLNESIRFLMSIQDLRARVELKKGDILNE
jgi:hypothetical protein